MPSLLVKGLVLAVTGGGGSSWLTYDQLKELGYFEPSPMVLADLTTFKTTYEDNATNKTKVGYAYGKFLLDPDHKDNEERWQRLERWFRKAYREAPSEFEAVLKPLTDSAYKSLKESCRATYTTKEISDAKVSTTGEYMDILWTYCSAVEVAPIGLEEHWLESGWGKDTSNIKNLTSLVGSKDMWYHLYVKFLKPEQEKESNSLHTRFKNISSWWYLREECAKAFKSESRDDDTDSYGKDVKEYCVIDKTATFNKFPTTPV